MHCSYKHTHTHSKTDRGGQEKTETVGRGLTTDVHSCSQWSDGAFQMELNRNANRESPEMKPGGVSDGGRGAERNSTVSSVCYLFLISFFKQHVGQSSCCVFCSSKPVGKWRLSCVGGRKNWMWDLSSGSALHRCVPVVRVWTFARNPSKRRYSEDLGQSLYCRGCRQRFLVTKWHDTNQCAQIQAKVVSTWQSRDWYNPNKIWNWTSYSKLLKQ